jgi:predicted PurR-regulated permease PerM
MSRGTKASQSSSSYVLSRRSNYHLAQNLFDKIISVEGIYVTAQQTFRNTLIVIATLAGAYALFLSIRIIIVLLVAIIIASAVRPTFLWLKARGFSEGLAILIIYGSIFLTLFALSVLILPPAAQQFTTYIENERNLAERLVSTQNWIQARILETTGTQVTLLDPDAIRVTVTDAIQNLKAAIPVMAGEFGGLLGDFILVFVMGAYWLTSRDQAVSFILHLVDVEKRPNIHQIVLETENSMGAYVRGIILVCTFVGVANFIILLLLGVPNAVTLGFIVGITTALPIIGGYIGAFTAVLLALLSSPLHAIFAFTSFVLVQQIENHWMTPRVMANSVGLNPILIIVFIFVGFALGGVVGALIAIPLAGTVGILFRHLVVEPRQEETMLKGVDGAILIPGKTPLENPGR